MDLETQAQLSLAISATLKMSASPCVMIDMIDILILSDSTDTTE
jgi:hypothetical protein